MAQVIPTTAVRRAREQIERERGATQTRIIPVRPYLGVGAPRKAALVLLLLCIAFAFALAFAFAFTLILA